MRRRGRRKPALGGLALSAAIAAGVWLLRRRRDAMDEERDHEDEVGRHD